MSSSSAVDEGRSEDKISLKNFSIYRCFLNMLNKLRKKATALVCTSSYLCILALSAFDNFYLYTIAFCLAPFFYYMRWFKVDVFNRTHFVCRKVFFYRRVKNTTKIQVLLQFIMLFCTNCFFDLDRFKL